MLIIKKLMRIGDSDGFILDKKILEKKNLKRGDYIKINFEKVEE